MSSTTVLSYCAIISLSGWVERKVSWGNHARLMSTAEMRLATRGPFHLQATVRVLQRRPANPLDVWDGSRYLRVLTLESGRVLTAVTNAGTVAKPDLRVALLARDPDAVVQGDLDEIGRRIALVLGLNVDPAPLHRAALSEPNLRQVASALRGMRPPCFSGLFETFLSVIPFQQLSLDAGISIVRRIVERFGHVLDYAGTRFHSSPDCGAIAAARPAALRACGLSARKADSLRAIASEIASGALEADQFAHTTTDEALRSLRDLPGIGPWSAALVLLRGFRRIDVFPPGDVGAKRALGRLLNVGEDEVYKQACRFGGLRGYLYFLALAASLLEKGLIEPAD